MADKHEKGGVALLIIREMPLKPSTRHFTFPCRLPDTGRWRMPCDSRGVSGEHTHTHTLQVYLGASCISTTRLCHLCDLMPGRWPSNLPWTEKSQPARLPQAHQPRTGNQGHLRPRDPMSDHCRAVPRHSYHSHYYPSCVRDKKPLAV